MTYRRLHRSVAVAGLLAAALAAGQAGAGPVAAAAPGSLVGPAPLAGTATWAAELSAIDADDVNVMYRDGALQLADLATPPAGALRGAAVEGILLLAGHPLPEPARQVRAELVAELGRGAVEVEVRGLGTTGWSDWHRVPGDGAVFDRRVTLVEVRVRLTVAAVPDRVARGAAAPRVSALTLTAT